MASPGARFQNIECPVDFVPMNENVARVNAFLVLVLVAVWWVTGYDLIPALLAVDFAVRAANYGKFSPVNIAGGFLVKLLTIPTRLVERAPKRFAALVGFIFSAAISLLSLAQLPLAARVLASVLLFFAALEAFFRF